MRHSTIGSWYGYPQHEDLNIDIYIDIQMSVYIK